MNNLLSSYASTKDNNFNLIRFTAATLVLITHFYVLSTGNPTIEPLRQVTCMTLGGIAVDIFFILSGFLLSYSLFSKGSFIYFAFSRVLRIYPGIIVANFLTIVILGLFFTEYAIKDFFSNKEVYEYFFYNSQLYSKIIYYLPGTFTYNPFQGIVNGSLWTLPYELRMYRNLAILAIFIIAFAAVFNERKIIKYIF